MHRSTLPLIVVAAALAAGSRAGAEPPSLPAQVQQAVREWSTGGPEPPALDVPGAHVVPFGRRATELVCAPMHVCAVQLEEGEQLLDTMLGDTEQWVVSAGRTGPGGNTRILALKPTAPGLHTDLLITTDRRVYSLSLRSHGTGDDSSGGAPFVLRFYYPDQLVRQWASASASSAEHDAAATAIDASKLEDLYFDYQVDGDRSLPHPVRVFDDGKQTYLSFSKGDHRKSAPGLFLMDSHGKLEAVTFNVHAGANGDTYVVDRVFREAVLVFGTGRNDKLTIRRHQA